MHMLRQGCSLNMPHRACEKLHGGIRLGGLSMPNILHMLMARGVKEDPIP